MNRFEEENPTVRWLPGFVRRWFGLTNDDPRRSVGGRYRWMPMWLKRLLNLDDVVVQYADELSPLPQAASPAYPSSYTPGAPSYRPGTPSFTPRSFNPPSYQPAADTSPSTPTRLSLAGDELSPDVQPIGYLLRAYARGALPPQGLEAFTREVRTTTEKVLNFYGYWFRFQTEELLRIGGDLCNALINALPGEPAQSQTPPTIRRIKVVADNGNGNTSGSNSVSTSSSVEATTPTGSETEPKE